MPKPKIHPIKIDFEITVSEDFKIPRFVYMFIVESKKLHLIDTGVAAAYNRLTSHLKSIARDVSEIENVFLTHSHPDHIGAAKIIDQKTQCNFYSSKEEKEWIYDTKLQFQQRPVPGFHDLVEGSIGKINVLMHGQEIELEKKCTIKSIHTPGHSAGSTSFYLKELNVLFSGDAILLPGEIPIFENITNYLASLETIIKLKPEIIYSSWSNPHLKDEIPEVLFQSKNYILQIRKTVKYIAQYFKHPNSIKFCETVLQELGQNKNLANPLLLQSFLACLEE